ncbi:MAG: response regulator [Butyricicoccus sp.]
MDALRTGGRAACAAVHRAGRPCRAYIIDWRLPDMNGIEVARQIRSLNDDTPIIILTATTGRISKWRRRRQA